VQTDALQRVAAAEVEARRKEAQCARLREEELQRLAGVEERIVEPESPVLWKAQYCCQI
jgi:hypothetical protein